MSQDVALQLEEVDDGDHTVRVNSRNVDNEAIQSQRVEAAIASQHLSRLSRRTTRTALEEPDMRTSFQRFSASMRISRMGTMKQNKMISEVSTAAPMENLKGKSLEERLQTFQMPLELMITAYKSIVKAFEKADV